MRSLLFLFFCFVFCISFSQNSLDSLNSIWRNENQPDTIRLKALDDYIFEGFIYSSPDSAFQLSKILYNMALSAENDEYIGTALANMGQSKLFGDDLKSAEEFANQNLEFAKSINDTLGLPRAYNFKGMVHNNKMEFEPAKNAFNKSIELAIQQEQNHLLSNAFHNLGILYFKFSDFKQAISSFDNAIEMEEKYGGIRGVSMTKKEKANVYYKMGNFSASYSLYLSVLESTENSDELVDIYAETCSDLGNLLFEQGSYDESAKYYLRSISISKQHNFVLTEAIAKANLGSNYNEIEEYDKALDHFESALDLFKKVGHKYGTGVCYTNIGEVSTSLKKFDTAYVYLNRGLDIFKEINSYEGMSSSYNYLANLSLAKSLFDDCIRNCNLSLDFSKKHNLHEQTIMSYKVLFRANILKGDTKSAYQVLKETRDFRDRDLELNYFTMSEDQKEEYFRVLVKDYNNYFDFAVHFSDDFPSSVHNSFDIALRTKGLSLKSTSALRQEIMKSGDDEVIELYKDFIRIKEEIASNYSSGADIDELESEARELERQLIAKSNSFSTFDQLSKVNWQSIQKELEGNEAVVEFIHFKSELDSLNRVKYAALLLKSEGEPELISICYEEELQLLLRKDHRGDRDFVTELYGESYETSPLFDLIWKPIVPYIESVNNIYISPSGLLHKVAFSAIPSPGKDIYLAQNMDVNINNSSSILLTETDEKLDKSDNFLMIGGVEYSSDSTEQKIWNYLPGTLEETNKIVDLLEEKEYEFLYLKDQKATEDQFKNLAVQSSIVHVATHGFFFPDPTSKHEEEVEIVEDMNFRGSSNYARWSFVENKNPLMRSGITFSRANDVWRRSPYDLSEDGVFTAKEAAALDFSKTKLIVLSACETGLGDIKGSEGVYGLQRALKISGVDHLIMSLWQVPDKETSEFMQLFYQKLLETNSINRSFHDAQSIMSKRYSPYYWAAFVLIE